MAFFSTIIAWTLKLGLGGIIDKTLGHLERRVELQTDREALKTKVSIEHIRAAVEETRIMADLNKVKMGNVFFWIFAALFIFPLGFWWSAVIYDSVFDAPWQVANLPTPEMRSWAGDMIKWLFYTGSVATAVKILK